MTKINAIDFSFLFFSAIKRQIQIPAPTFFNPVKFSLTVTRPIEYGLNNYVKGE